MKAVPGRGSGRRRVILARRGVQTRRVYRRRPYVNQIHVQGLWRGSAAAWSESTLVGSVLHSLGVLSRVALSSRSLLT
jgi:hypothetical protein